MQTLGEIRPGTMWITEQADYCAAWLAITVEYTDRGKRLNVMWMQLWGKNVTFFTTLFFEDRPTTEELTEHNTLLTYGR